MTTSGVAETDICQSTQPLQKF